LVGLPEPRQPLGSLLPDEVPPGSKIQAPPVTFAAPAHAQTVRPVGADRTAVRQGTPALVPGRGPSDPWSRIVRASTEGTAIGSHAVFGARKRHQHLDLNLLNLFKLELNTVARGAKVSTKICGTDLGATSYDVVPHQGHDDVHAISGTILWCNDLRHRVM
jgi:hypothetical protein